jgi:hypothetical protein
MATLWSTTIPALVFFALVLFSRFLLSFFALVFCSRFLLSFFALVFCLCFIVLFFYCFDLFRFALVCFALVCFALLALLWFCFALLCFVRVLWEPFVSSLMFLIGFAEIEKRTTIVVARTMWSEETCTTTRTL